MTEKYELSCGIVEDLLPSYVDGLTGPESNEALCAHMETCAHCREKYEAMKRPPSAQPTEETRELNYLKVVRRKRHTAVLTAVICTVLVLAAVWLVKLYVIGTPAEQGEFSYSVSAVENTLELTARPAVYGRFRIGLAQSNVRIEDGAAYITVRKIDTGRRITDVTPDMIKTVTVDLTQVDEVYLCGALIWQDGLTISQATNQLYRNQVDYVGNASAVTALWGQMDPGFSAYTVSLQTEAAPYGFTVVFREPLDNRQSAMVHAQMRKAGEEMLALTGNLGVFSWTYEDAGGETYSESITLEEVNASLPGLVKLYNQIYGTDWEALPSVKDYAASPASLQQLREILDMPH